MGFPKLTQVFGTPVPLSLAEIKDLVQRFALAAQVCQEAGFTGVQFHAAHGYLLSQFLSPRVNQRNDEYGGSLERRARVLLEVVRETRKRVGPTFPIAVKLNSADFQKGGFNSQDSLQVVQWLQDASVDLVEISGGTYEQPAMMGDNDAGLEEREDQRLAPSTLAREAYFVDFAKALQSMIQIPLMVTGGFRSRVAMTAAVESGAVQVIGLGRPMCVMTDAPKQLLEQGLNVLPSYENQIHLIPSWMSCLKKLKMVRMVEGMAVIYWFYEQLVCLGETGATNLTLSVFKASVNVETRNKRLASQRTLKAKDD